MKIISWNCQGAFRNKNESILNLKPDLIIIPECENESKLKIGKLLPTPNDLFWYGENLNKGIGIFSYSDFKIELVKSFNPKFRYVIPLKVSNSNSSFFLFAVWAMDDKENKHRRYIGQLWEALAYYKELLNTNSIIIGDLNSNKIWDTKNRIANHTDVVSKLKQSKIQSLYHLQNKENHGEESENTFFLYRNKTKPYHIDYCFASDEFTNSKYQIRIGKVEDWIDQSDHCPLIVEIKPPDYKLEFINSLYELLELKFSELAPGTIKAVGEHVDLILKEGKEFDSTADNNENERLQIIEKVSIILKINSEIKKLKNEH